MTDPHIIAAKLSDAQRLYLTSSGDAGSARGLVQRGLLTYRWGNDSSYGYNLTVLGGRVRDVIKREARQ